MTDLDGLAVASAVLLAVLFAAAAAAKFRDPAATARGFRALGVPKPWPLARAVPVVEALLALTLVVTPGPAAVVAVVLLSGFTVFLAGRLRAGVHAPCACFGSRSGRALSVADLVRNLWLIAASAVATTAGPLQLPALGAWAATAAATALAAASVSLVRRCAGAGIGRDAGTGHL